MWASKSQFTLFSIHIFGFVQKTHPEIEGFRLDVVGRASDVATESIQNYSVDLYHHTCVIIAENIGQKMHSQTPKTARISIYPDGERYLD